MPDTYRKRNAETWEMARRDYVTGLSAEAVCRRYDLGISAFRRRARVDGWRRVDHDDPAYGDYDLSIYDDVGPGDQVETARLRFVEALNNGRSTEAARWRRVWHALRKEAGLPAAPAVQDLGPPIPPPLTACPTVEESFEPDLEAAMDGLAPPLAPELIPARAENVHNVHSNFLSATQNRHQRRLKASRKRPRDRPG